jgi:methanogenic corrinoid protein MtbC1
VPELHLITQQLVDALLHIDDRRCRALLSDFVSGKSAPLPLETLVVPALESIGKAWEEGRISLSQVFMAGRICEKALGQILPAENSRRFERPKLAIGVLEDYHALGKRMVISALHSSGYRVQDYGHGLQARDLVTLAIRDEIDILLVSCLMLASALHVKDIVDGLKKAGSRTVVVVGGAPFRLDLQLWQETGAWAMGRSSAEAISIVQSWQEALL